MSAYEAVPLGSREPIASLYKGPAK